MLFTIEFGVNVFGGAGFPTTGSVRISIEADSPEEACKLLGQRIAALGPPVAAKDTDKPTGTHK